MRALLRAVSERDPNNDYAKQLIAAFSGATGRAVADREGPERRYASGWNLTNRELEVLGLLQHRWTNDEIAARLGVSTETVRKHTVNLYRKLGVGNRREAVRVALERGILA